MPAALIVSLTLLAVVTVLWRRAVAKSAAANAKTAEADAEVARLAASLSGSNDGLIVVDERGHVVASNPVAVEIMGISSGDHTGRRLEALVSWPLLHEALKRSRDHGESQSFDFEPDGSAVRTLHVEVHALPGSGAVVAVEDHSRLKRLESLRREFVANVSHELKTPLAAIKGFVETMQDDPEMPVEIRQRFTERVRQQTDRLATLVSDLLTLSSLDHDPGMLTSDPCDLATVLADTIRDLMPIAEQRGITIVSRLPDKPVWVRADGEALRQMAGNLVDNALKYTPEQGTVTVRLNTSSARSRLEVADTGIGLSPTDQERIFERFYRVDRARSREIGGTGLGLSIVKNTALSLGGDIGVNSELGVGSMFWVELPLLP